MPATIQMILTTKVPRSGFALDFHSGFFACISAMVARKYAALGSYPIAMPPWSDARFSPMEVCPGGCCGS